MKLIEPEFARSTVVLVSRNNAAVNGLKQTWASRTPFSEQIELVVVADINVLASIDFSDVGIVLCDLSDFSKSTEDLERTYKNIERLRIIKNKSCLAFMALEIDLSFDERREFVTRAGMDVVLSGHNYDDILLNVIGITRLLNYSTSNRQSRFERKHIDETKIGAWTLLNGSRSVENPNGKRQKLTDTEWNFLLFLVDRDIKKVDVAENTSRWFENEINAKSIAYKIRKKLGSDFPIVSKGRGEYELAP